MAVVDELNQMWGEFGIYDGGILLENWTMYWGVGWCIKLEYEKQAKYKIGGVPKILFCLFYVRFVLFE